MTGREPPEGDPAGYHSIAAFARGDRSRAERLRQSLTQIRDHHPDPAVTRAAGDVLAGRRTLREVVRDASFLRAMGVATTTLARQWSELDPDQRAALIRQAINAESSDR